MCGAIALRAGTVTSTGRTASSPWQRLPSPPVVRGGTTCHRPPRARTKRSPRNWSARPAECRRAAAWPPRRVALHDATPRGEGLGISAVGWANAMLNNGLGRYTEALAARAPCSTTWATCSPSSASPHAASSAASCPPPRTPTRRASRAAEPTVCPTEVDDDVVLVSHLLLRSLRGLARG